jgi:hypothetical protein
MKRSMAVLWSVCLTLGLLMAVGGRVWAQDCTCTPSTPPPAPLTCATVNFGGALIGNPSAGTGSVTLAAGQSVMLSITGPNPTDFNIINNTCQGATGPTACTFLLVFNPLGCGTRNATLTATLTSTAGSCQLIIPLTGFGCSFDCAIFATSTASLSPTTRDRILRELFLAQADAATRCFHLNCALCLIVPESLRNRAGAGDVEAQILCLLTAFACPPVGSSIID